MSSNPPQQHCCANKVIHTGTPTGSIKTISNLTCYVTSNYTPNAKKFLFIFTDIFGLDLVNTKLVADTFAEKLDYPVIIMDILNNDIYVLGTDFDAWVANHPPELTTKICADFFKQFKIDHPNTEFLSGIGYCFGAKYLSHYLTSTNPLIDVGAFAHPSFVSDEELEAINKPLIISCAENDDIFSKDLRFKSEEILKKNKIHYQLDLYSNTNHGFAVRGDLNDPLVKYAAEKALIDQVYWFKFHENN